MSKRIVVAAALLMLTALAFDTARSQSGTDPYGTTGTTTSQSSAATDPTMASSTDPAMTADDGTLPETASPWPLLGLLGLSTFGAGLVLRRRRP
jgi:LPXTG-motif cell wall-anchored protein